MSTQSHVLKCDMVPVERSLVAQRHHYTVCGEPWYINIYTACTVYIFSLAPMRPIIILHHYPAVHHFGLSLEPGSNETATLARYQPFFNPKERFIVQCDVSCCWIIWKSNPTPNKRHDTVKVHKPSSPPLTNDEWVKDRPLSLHAIKPHSNVVPDTRWIKWYYIIPFPSSLPPCE